jgi:hypothetical protein
MKPYTPHRNSSYTIKPIRPMTVEERQASIQREKANANEKEKGKKGRP